MRAKPSPPEVTVDEHGTIHIGPPPPDVIHPNLASALAGVYSIPPIGAHAHLDEIERAAAAVRQAQREGGRATAATRRAAADAELAAVEKLKCEEVTTDNSAVRLYLKRKHEKWDAFSRTKRSRLIANCTRRLRRTRQQRINPTER